MKRHLARGGFLAARRTALGRLAVFAVFAAFFRCAASAGTEEIELALKLGLGDVAFERAAAALDALRPGPERDRAFLLAASAKERTAEPAAFLEWLGAVPSPPASEAWFRARALSALGRDTEAAEALKPFVEALGADDPIRPLAVADLAHALSRSGADSEAALLVSRASGSGDAPVSVFAIAAGIAGGGAPGDDIPDPVRALAFAAAASMAAGKAGGDGGAEALDFARRAVALAAGDPAVLAECQGVLLGLLALRGESGEAVDLARKLVAGERSGAASAALRSAAESFLARKDASSALLLADLHDASFSDPAAEPQTQRLRALALEALGRVAEAVAAWDSAAEAAAAAGGGSAPAEPRLEAARLVLAEGRIDDAEARLADIRRTGAAGAFADRLSRLEAECLAARGSPEAPLAFERIAAAGEGRAEALDAAVRAAETTAPGDPALSGRAAAARAALAEMAEAAVSADETATVLRRQASAALAVALKSLKAGDAAGALPGLEVAAANSAGGPDAERAKALLPAAYQAAGRDGEALASFAIFTNQHPASVYLPDLRFWRAARAFDSGDWTGAADALLALASEFPDSGKAPYSIYLATVALLRAGREDDAIAAVDRLAAAYPDSELLPQARFMQADALVSLMRFDAAALAFARVTGAGASDPSLPLRAAMRRADCLYALGGEFPPKRAEGLALYRQVFSDPGCAASGLEPECRWKIGRALAKDGDRTAALAEWFDGCIAPFERNPTAAAAPWYARAVFSAAAELAAAGRQADAAALLSRLAGSADLPGREEAARRIEALGASPAPFPAGTNSHEDQGHS